MTLYHVMHSLPCLDTVTVEDYVNHDILIDCEAVENVLNSRKYHQDLKNCQVIRLEVGKVFGDLIISILV